MIDTPAIEKLLGELEALHDKATPGPWRSTGIEYEPEAGWFVREGGEGRYLAVASVRGTYRPRDEIEANGRLIAETRSSLSTLITTIRALMEAVEEQRAERALLQDILDSRPAINAGLPESYVRWSQAIYSGEIFRAAIRSKGDA